MRCLFYILFAVLAVFLSQPEACTTAIVSGKNTADGRPLLFKHRDTPFLQNRLVYFSDGKFDYIGLVNASDTSGKEVWAGHNAAGFAIMNSESYNLNVGDTTSLKDRDGIIMKHALQICRTVADFESLLTVLAKPLGVRANFGVIDAYGGAAYYETGHYSFRKIDVNDPATAPHGYLIRTNYSSSGKSNRGYGYIRYQTAEQLLRRAIAEKNLTPRFLLQSVSRSLDHALTGINLYREDYAEADTPLFYNFRDYIPRYSSASTYVVHGCSDPKKSMLTTAWAILGFQLCSVAVPVWIAAGDALPRVLTADKGGNAPLCDMALKLKKKCFPITRGSGRYYINLSALLNTNNTGIWQQLRLLDDMIFEQTEREERKWTAEKERTKNIQNHYDWLDSVILGGYDRQFGL